MRRERVWNKVVQWLEWMNEHALYKKTCGFVKKKMFDKTTRMNVKIMMAAVVKVSNTSYTMWSQFLDLIYI